jgi:putative spermidine/putrescine transport system ATP-binding protein
VELGRIRELVYVGMVTRYAVALDAGGELVVVRQNLERTSADLVEERGRSVQLSWFPEHTFTIEAQTKEEE